MTAPPQIFAPNRRYAAHRRMRTVQARGDDGPRYLLDDMVADCIERLQFLRHEPRRALVIGDWSRTLPARIAQTGCDVAEVLLENGPADSFVEERPLPHGGYDFIASLGSLDTVNDLPGALIHLRHALAPGGLMIASFLGAGCLPALRAAMLLADGERPAARFHPMVDVRAGGQLLQRCGFAMPVVDQRRLKVRFSSFEAALADLRAQGLTCVLASAGPALTREMRAIAKHHFETAQRQEPEQFEILTLSGWRSA